MIIFLTNLESRHIRSERYLRYAYFAMCNCAHVQKHGLPSNDHRREVITHARIKYARVAPDMMIAVLILCLFVQVHRGKV